MTIGPQKDEKDDKSPKRWQTLEKMTTDNSEYWPDLQSRTQQKQEIWKG